MMFGIHHTCLIITFCLFFTFETFVRSRTKGTEIPTSRPKKIEEMIFRYFSFEVHMHLLDNASKKLCS